MRKRDRVWLVASLAVLVTSLLIVILIVSGSGVSETVEMAELADHLEGELEIVEVTYYHANRGEIKRALLHFPGAPMKAPVPKVDRHTQHRAELGDPRAMAKMPKRQRTRFDKESWRGTPLDSVWCVQMPSEQAALRRVNPNFQRQGYQWYWGWFFFEGEPKHLAKIKALLE